MLILNPCPPNLNGGLPCFLFVWDLGLTQQGLRQRCCALKFGGRGGQPWSQVLLKFFHQPTKCYACHTPNSKFWSSRRVRFQIVFEPCVVCLMHHGAMLIVMLPEWNPHETQWHVLPGTLGFMDLERGASCAYERLLSLLQ